MTNTFARNIIFRLTVILGLLLIIPGLSKAQEDIDIEKDTELWTGVSLKLDLKKKFSLDLKEEVRFNQNVSNIRQVFTQATLGYELSKRWELGLQYRFMFTDKEHNMNRIALDVKYGSKKLFDTPLKLGYRLRIQNNRQFYTGRSVLIARNKVGFEYKINKKWTPYLDYELQLMFEGEEAEGNNRFTVGAKYKVNKHSRIKAFARLQYWSEEDEVEQVVVFGLNYAYSMKPRRKKKKK